MHELKPAMRAVVTVVFATALLLVTIGSAKAGQASAPAPMRHLPAAAPIPAAPLQPGARLQRDLPLGTRTGPGTLAPNNGPAAGSPIHLEMPQRGPRPLVFPSPVPTKTPEFNPLILPHEA